MKFSVVIPAYNEYENLKILLNRFAQYIKSDDIEVIIVNNASADDSENLLNQMQAEYHFLKVVTLKVNEGYGNGIKQGLLTAQGEYVGWMHADLQSDVADMFKAIDIVNSMPAENVFVKGRRINRNLIAKFFTLGMSIFSSVLFGKILYDIGAQPNLFSKELLNSSIKNAPNDWLFDLYFYYSAIQNNYKIIRFPSKFGERIYSQSFWNTGLLSRFKFSFQIMKSSINLKKRLKNEQ